MWGETMKSRIYIFEVCTRWLDQICCFDSYIIDWRHTFSFWTRSSKFVIIRPLLLLNHTFPHIHELHHFLPIDLLLASFPRILNHSFVKFDSDWIWFYPAPRIILDLIGYKSKDYVFWLVAFKSPMLSTICWTSNLSPRDHNCYWQTLERFE